jgi:hypothetical protein
MNLRQKLVEKKALLAWAIVISFLFSSHFVLSIFVPRDRQIRPFVAPAVRATVAHPDFDAKRSKLLVWMPLKVEETKIPERQPRLVGVFVSKVAGVRASIQWSSPTGLPPPSYTWVSVGDVVEGWKVTAVAPRRVEIARGDQRLELLLFEVDEGKLTSAIP